MSYRFATLCTVLTLLACTNPLYAQSLTADQQAKLDGRFENIVKLSDKGRLNTQIQSAQKKASPQLRRPEAPEVSYVRQMGEGQKRRQRPSEPAVSAFSDQLPIPLPQDVRPSTYRSDGTPVYEAIVYGSNVSVLDEEGVQVNSAFEGFATVRATPSGLKALSRIRAVSRVFSARQYQLDNDEAVAETGAKTLNEGVGGTAYRGKDVMACVIDSGIDWSHPDFTDENGKTRIHSIWDHPDDSTSVPTPEENDASRFGSNFTPDYGSEYLPSDIRAGNVNQEDRNGHGTHVAGTVASSGRAYKQSSGTMKFRGVAPDANIVAVKTTFSNVSILDGINYCKSVAEAEGKPVVVNMSLGSNFAPHDGTSPLARGVDALTNGGSASGIAVVASAGNFGSPFTPTHTSGNIAADDSADVSVPVPEYDTLRGSSNDFYTTTLWTYEEGPYSMTVYTPGKQDTLTVSLEDSVAVTDSFRATPRGAIYVESAPYGSARYFLVQSFDLSSTQPPAEGEWTVRLRSEGGQSSEYHGWFLSSSMGAGFKNADNAYTVHPPSTARSAIAVGAYVHRQRWTSSAGTSFGYPLGSGFTRDHTASFSSRGPTVDGRQKPAVSAPGAFTASAFSDDAPSPLFGQDFVVGDGEHQLVSGTSMSSPVTAGTVALLLQEEPTLSTDEARSLLSQTARVDDRVEARGGAWNPTFGFGKVDALGALTQLRSDTEEASAEILSYENDFANDQATAETVGETGAERLALRFTPTQAGALTGTHLSLGSNEEEDPANELTDSLYVQVWTDDGTGMPEAPLGNRVAIPAQRLSAYTPNFVDLRPARVAVEADSNYHLVVTPKANGGTLEVLAETADATAGRSTMFDGSSWSETGNDLVIRVQVGGGLSTEDQTPPSAPGLVAARAFADSVQLHWNSSPSSDVAKYRIYRDTAPIDSAAGPGGIAVYDSVSAGATAYTDTSVQLDTQYHYRLTAVDDSSNESGFSGELTATPLLPPDVAVRPDSLSATLAGDDSSSQSLRIENTATGTARNLDFRLFLREAQSKSETSKSLMKAQRPARSAASWEPTVPEAAGSPSVVASPKSHSSTPPVIVNDPDNDAEKVEVTKVRSGVQGDQINVVIEHASAIDSNDYGGFMSFDVDQDTSTGENPSFANSEQELGAEYEASFFAISDGAVTFTELESGNVSQLPASVDSSALHFSIPLSLIDGSPPMNVTGVVGDAEGPTDWFPNAGNATIGVSWIAVSPSSGSVAPGGAQNLTASFDATGLKDSTYEATIQVASNDPDEDTVDVPVSLTVERPEAPTSLAASVDTTAVTLTWNEVADSSVAGYNVYRSTSAFTNPDGATKLNSSLLSDTTYTDTGREEGTTYYYRVTAADGSGVESVPSNQAQATIPDPDRLVVDGRIDDPDGVPEYTGLGTNVDSADGFSPKNDIDSLLYYPDPEEEALYVAVTGTLETSRANGYALFLNVTGSDAPEGAPAGDTLGFPFEGTNHHFLTGDEGAYTGFTADFEVDYVVAASPTGGGETFAEAAAYSSGGTRAVRRLGVTDESGTPATGAGPGGEPVTFAHLNAEAPKTGAEFKIPFSELGALTGADVTEDQNVQVFAVIVSATGYFSNETIPGNATQIADSTTDGGGNPGFNADWNRYAGGPYHTGGDGLPVELASFEGSVKEDAVALSWTTASEQNNAGFRVQRRTAQPSEASSPATMSQQDASTTWTTVGRVEGAGTSSQAQSYRFTDTDLPYEADVLTYRLKQMDTDGSVQYSKKITVQRSVKEVQLLGTYPNPASQRATVRYALPEKQEVQVRLYDILGRRVRTVVHEKQEGRHKMRLDVSTLSSGVYFLRLRSEGKTRTQKVTIVR